MHTGKTKEKAVIFASSPCTEFAKVVLCSKNPDQSFSVLSGVHSSCFLSTSLALLAPLKIIFQPLTHTPGIMEGGHKGAQVGFLRRLFFPRLSDDRRRRGSSTCHGIPLEAWSPYVDS